jgi:hypothetical protein
MGSTHTWEENNIMISYQSKWISSWYYLSKPQLLKIKSNTNQDGTEVTIPNLKSMNLSLSLSLSTSGMWWMSEWSRGGRSLRESMMVFSFFISDLLSYGANGGYVSTFFCCCLYEKGLYWYGEGGGTQYGSVVRSAPPVRMPAKHHVAPGSIWIQ